MDILPLLEGDLRTQVVFTRGPDVFGNGVDSFLNRLGGLVIPWGQVRRHRFDLALMAAYGGMSEVHAPVMVLPHGAGYNKYPSQLADDRRHVRRGAFGLTPDVLVQDGRVLPAALVLSHHEQLGRLAESCPEAVPVAIVAGDPCFDRLVVSRPLRREYRQALHVTDGQRLIVVSSTWGRGSLIGRRPELLGALSALPREGHRVVAALHPNVWFGHGMWQVNAWLADCRRAGLSTVRPEEGWQAAVTAADLVIGDHGSVTLYAAAVGVPVLLAAFPRGDLDPASPVARLGRTAPGLRADQPLTAQIERALTRQVPFRQGEFADLATSEVGRSAAILRQKMYRLLGLPEPSAPAQAVPFRIPAPAEGHGIV